MHEPMKRRRLSPFAITQWLMAIVIGVALWLAYWPWRWGRVKEEVRMQYPAVKRIDAPTLQSWMANRTVAPPVLLDVRSVAEFQTSHLPGARRIDPGATLAENGLAGFESAQLVIYDAVGFEAAAFAGDLMRRAFIDVQVLEGGIFQWANERRPLAGPGGSTDKVLPGPSEYISLLHRARRAR
jgi:rhodanese-related sulfurtransferase